MSIYRRVRWDVPPAGGIPRGRLLRGVGGQPWEDPSCRPECLEGDPVGVQLSLEEGGGGYLKHIIKTAMLNSITLETIHYEKNVFIGFNRFEVSKQWV